MQKKHPNLIKIGANIARLRKEHGVSQEKLAHLAILGRTYVGRIERGEQNVSIQNLIQIAFALDQEVSELIPLLEELNDPRQD